MKNLTLLLIAFLLLPSWVDAQQNSGSPIIDQDELTYGIRFAECSDTLKNHFARVRFPGLQDSDMQCNHADANIYTDNGYARSWSEGNIQSIHAQLYLPDQIHSVRRTLTLEPVADFVNHVVIINEINGYLLNHNSPSYENSFSIKVWNAEGFTEGDENYNPSALIWSATAGLTGKTLEVSGGFSLNDFIITDHGDSLEASLSNFYASISIPSSISMTDVIVEIRGQGISHTAPEAAGVLSNIEPGNIPGNISVNIYPNPASEYIILQIPENGKAEKIQFFSSDGRQVFSQALNFSGNIKIPVGHLPRGIYLLHFEESGLTSKVILH